MQIKNIDFNPEEHEQYKALSVKNPYATLIAEGKKKIEVRNKKTKFRGTVLICSSQFPIVESLESGCTLAFVEIYDCKKVSELTDDEWELTKINASRDKFKDQFAWLMRNPEKVIEFPVKGQLGIYSLTYTKGNIMKYPKNNFNL